MECNKENRSNSIQNNKENYSVLTKIQVKVSQPSIRNPLVDLRVGDFVLENININKQKVSTVKNEDPAKKKVREFRTKTVQTEPISGTSKNFAGPARKITLQNKLKKNCTQFREEDTYTDTLYETEYFMDNYQYMLELEKKFVFLKSHLGEHIDVEYRATIVNWLIHVQQSLNMSQSSLFKSIRIMDCYLSAPYTKVNKRSYSLVAITSIWITSKMCDSNTVTVCKLNEVYKKCLHDDFSHQFTKQEILSMEKQILKYIKFNLNCPDPDVFLYYYLHKEKLENNKNIWFSAMFLLETSTLSLEFSSAFPSLLAATALYLVLCKYYMNTDSFLEYIHFHLVNQDMFKVYAKEIGRSIKEILKQDRIRDQVTNKYYTPQTLFVAQYFIN